MTRKDAKMTVKVKANRNGKAGGGGGGKRTTTGAKRAAAPAVKLWELRLYVAGQTPKSMAALTNLQRICDQHLPGQYHIDVVDLLKNPHLAQGDQIVAIPTLVRKLPEPIKRVIGDLSNLERVLVGMDIRAAG